VTGGIISAKGRPLNLIPDGLMQSDPAATGYAIEDFLQTDAVINPGNSGGPLLNLRGEVIGVNTAIASSTGYNQGYAFAIPSNLASRVMRDLIAYGHVRRPMLGVQIAEIAPEDAEAYGLEGIAGARIDDFGEDSPARKAGLERHDVIVALGGQRIERVGQLQRLVALRSPGDTVRVSVVRWGRALEVPVVLSQAPVVENLTTAAAPERAPSARETEGLGVEVGELDAATARELGYVRAGGAVVDRVTPFGAADRKGIASGDRIVTIGRMPVRSAREARALLRAAGRGQVISMLLETPGGRTYIANVRVP
jgi:serine protease Do